MAEPKKWIPYEGEQIDCSPRFVSKANGYTYKVNDDNYDTIKMYTDRYHNWRIVVEDGDGSMSVRLPDGYALCKRERNL